MEHISVKKLSPKSLAKLKRGHPVRLMKGEGMQLCVSPDKFNHICRCFTMGKGVNMSLSPEEIAHNHGKGIFDKIKQGVSAIAKSDAVQKAGQRVSEKVMDKALEHGEKYLEKKLMGEGVHHHHHHHHHHSRALSAGALDHDILEKINELTGQKLGAFAKANAYQAGAEQLRANMEKAFTKALEHSPTGYGLFAAPPSGMGLYAAGLLHPRHRVHHHHHKKMIEKGSIGINGNLLGLPPALQSQPYGANFQFASRLPPAYANQIKNGDSVI